MLFKNMSLRFFKSCTLLLGLLVVTGCSSLATRHNLYEGEADNAAIILSSDTIQVEYIDNRDVGVSFIGQSKEFAVLPGQHTLIMKYADFWSPTTGDDEKVTSRPVKVTFTVEANQTYQLSHQRVDTLEKSQTFAKEPVFFVKNVDTNTIVDATFEASAPKSFLPELKFESTPEYRFASDGAAVASPPNRLQNLQQIWSAATKEEKAAFLQWITIK